MRKGMGLFRGKSLHDNNKGEWVEGNLSCNAENSFCMISPICCHLGDEYFIVDPETVGEFTGLLDKNGTKIFEGDTLSIEGNCLSVVEFNEGVFTALGDGILCDYSHQCEIIGTIYDDQPKEGSE